ncbi:MAG: hypothetical protein NTZ68_02920 [Candidatus Dependentiae bacterium]|nr:hypothetical protein [Candidatus Dependentiae bacterium]
MKKLMLMSALALSGNVVQASLGFLKPSSSSLSQDPFTVPQTAFVLALPVAGALLVDRLLVTSDSTSKVDKAFQATTAASTLVSVLASSDSKNVKTTNVATNVAILSIFGHWFYRFVKPANA